MRNMSFLTLTGIVAAFFKFSGGSFFNGWLTFKFFFSSSFFLLSGFVSSWPNNLLVITIHIIKLYLLITKMISYEDWKTYGAPIFKKSILMKNCWKPKKLLQTFLLSSGRYYFFMEKASLSLEKSNIVIYLASIYTYISATF